MCDAIIEKGLPVLPEESTLDIRDRFNCMVKLPDNQVIYIELPKDPELQSNFLRGIPIYNETNLPSEGIFTWILYRSPGSADIRFAATEAITPFEIGTMHKTMAWLVGAQTIHGAGEIHRSSEGNFFNVLSGTYMLRWKMEHYEDEVCTPDVLEDIVVKRVKPYLRSYEFVKTTFISQSQRVNPKVLEIYRAAGFTVKTFPNKAACVADPSTSFYRFEQAKLEAKRKAQEAADSRATELRKRIRSV
jgi:hypothetical protein